MNISKVFGIREEAVTSSSSLLTTKVKYLFDWWTAAGRGGLPLRSDFDIIDHRSIISDIFLVEVLPGNDFLIKIEGERVIELFGTNNSGRLVTQAAGIGEYGHAIHEYYRSIVEDKICKRCLGNLEKVNNRGWIEFESLDCPLSRDGRQVDFILGVIDTLPGRDGRMPGARSR